MSNRSLTSTTPGAKPARPSISLGRALARVVFAFMLMLTLALWLAWLGGA